MWPNCFAKKKSKSNSKSCQYSWEILDTGLLKRGYRGALRNSLSEKKIQFSNKCLWTGWVRQKKIVDVNCVLVILSILSFINALTIKGQNIGSWTKTFCKQMSDFDTLNNNKWKYSSLGSIKNHAFTCNAIDGWVVVHQN